LLALSEFATANTSGEGFAASSANLPAGAITDQFGNANASLHPLVETTNTWVPPRKAADCLSDQG
jgi:hypothetical protein